jgi:hypothetical protein
MLSLASRPASGHTDIMSRIPSPALVLGLAGLIPFLWGGATSVPLLHDMLRPLALPASFVGVPLLAAYGTIILSFMAGVIWGFVSREGGPWMASGLALSVLPALWIFAFTDQPDRTQLAALIAGFCGLLAIDYLCARRKLAPDWWVPLRLMLTAVVVFCLFIGFLFTP